MKKEALIPCTLTQPHTCLATLNLFHTHLDCLRSSNRYNLDFYLITIYDLTTNWTWFHFDHGVQLHVSCTPFYVVDGVLPSCHTHACSRSL